MATARTQRMFFLFGTVAGLMVALIALQKVQSDGKEVHTGTAKARVNSTVLDVQHRNGRSAASSTPVVESATEKTDVDNLRRRSDLPRVRPTATPESGDSYLGQSLIGVEPGFDAEIIFSEAGAEFGISPDLLKAIAFIESNMSHGTGVTNERGGRGIMGLRESEAVDTLSEAAALLKLDAAMLVRDPVQNVRGAAALLRKYHGEAASQPQIDRPWEIAISRYSGLPAEAAITYSQHVRNTLMEGLVHVNADGTTITIGSGQTLQ